MNSGPQNIQRCQGMVKKWFGEKGYGFLVPDGGGDDVFVHRRALAGIYDLNEGDQVMFEAEFEEPRGKWKAYKCTLLASADGGMPSMLPPGPQPPRGGGGLGKKGGGRGGNKGGGFPIMPQNPDDDDNGMPPMGMGMGMNMPGGFGLGKKGGGRGRGNKGGGGGGGGGGFPMAPMDPEDGMLGMGMGMGMPGGMPGNPQFGGGGGRKGGGKFGDDGPNDMMGMMGGMGMPDGKKGGGRGRGDGKGKGGKNSGGGRGNKNQGGQFRDPSGGGCKGGGKGFDLGGGPGGPMGGPMGGGGNRPQQQDSQPNTQMQVVAELPLNWVQLRGPEGTFFVNSTTRQVTQDVPPELRQLAAQQTMLQAPQTMPSDSGFGGPQQQFRSHPQNGFQQSPHQQVDLMSAQMPQQPPPMPHMQMPMGNQPPQQNSEVILKATIGDWLVCEDNQGVFYRDQRTGQTYDTPPPDLVRLYQQQMDMQPQQQQPPMQQPQNPMYQPHLQQAPYPGNPGPYSDYLDMPQAYEHQSM